MSDLDYKEKYLKYKRKYLDLKQNGGRCFLNSCYKKLLQSVIKLDTLNNEDIKILINIIKKFKLDREENKDKINILKQFPKLEAEYYETGRKFNETNYNQILELSNEQFEILVSLINENIDKKYIFLGIKNNLSSHQIKNMIKLITEYNVSENIAIDAAQKFNDNHISEMIELIDINKYTDIDAYKMIFNSIWPSRGEDPFEKHIRHNLIDDLFKPSA